MSRAGSPSTARRYGTARVCRVWEVPRSTLYERRARASRTAQPAAKRGTAQPAAKHRSRPGRTRR